MRPLKADLWKINLAAFIMLLIFSAGGTWLQLEFHNRTFKKEVMDHARLASDIIKLNAENVLTAENIVKKVFRQFLGNTAKFTSFLNMIEPFTSHELAAFARESGMVGIGILDNINHKETFGPAGWQKKLPFPPTCREGESQFYFLNPNGLMLFISPLKHEHCVIVAVDSMQLEKLEKHAGLKKTIERVSKLKGVSSVKLVKNSETKKNGAEKGMKPEGLTFKDRKVSIHVDTDAGRLIVEMDAEPFYNVRERTIGYFFMFAMGLLFTGGILTLIVYRYQKTYIKRIRDIEKAMAQEREDAVLGRSAATVAHEIRNPLNSVSMGLQSMQMGSVPKDSAPDLIETMLKEVKRANEIVNQMLRFSSYAKLDLEEISLQELVNEQLLLLNRPIEQQGITVSTYMEDIKIKADHSLMTQVILNLLRNAIKAQPDGGIIKIVIKQKNNFLNLSISNQGNMPDVDDMEQLFEPYFTTGTRGTGLGLAICRKIIKLHGGHIKALCEGGGFFKIKLWLPLN